ncbi:Beta-galactosidase C-terminal domain [Xylanivirga thermophila]|uniref:Beta-galactosidase C-terminal domain n=1 Tax=Xylanivirga thermophila TaxID=2496273 RepID=UPI002436BE17|nr:Beta-galactosidase C-terminal domain [Xylanivirga thermophila]
MGVTAQMRTDGERDYIFLQNYSDDTKTIFLNNMELKDLLTGNNAGEKIDMSAYSFKLLVRECK